MTSVIFDQLAVLNGGRDQFQRAPGPNSADPLGMTEAQRIMDAILRECFVSELDRDCVSLAHPKVRSRDLIRQGRFPTGCARWRV
jgi:hypothetical protein